MPGAEEISPNPASGATSPHPSPRFHHLDAIRAFALLLGVVMHAAEAFGPRNQYHAIVDPSTCEGVEWFRFACHSFRLELFFVIAGFFARLVLRRRGTRGFVWNRFQRIFLPLVVGWAFLYPMLVLLWIWGHSISGLLGNLGIPPEARTLPVWKLWIGFFMAGGLLRKFDLTHLWFLHQLLAVYIGWLGLRWLAKRTEAAERVTSRLDGLFAWAMRSRLSAVWFGLASVPPMLLMKTWVVDTPHTSLLPELAPTLLYGVCFMVGWFLHRKPDLLECNVPRGWWLLAIGLACCLMFILAEGRIPYRRFPAEQIRWARLIYASVYALMMWSFALGFLGLFVRFLSHPSPTTRYVADSSYWLYIVHLPLVVALQIALAGVPLPWQIKIPLILAIAFPLLFLSYHFMVRGTFIGRWLNGRKYPVGVTQE